MRKLYFYFWKHLNFLFNKPIHCKLINVQQNKPFILNKKGVFLDSKNNYRWQNSENTFIYVIKGAEHEYVGFRILPPVENFWIRQNGKKRRFCKVFCNYLFKEALFFITKIYILLQHVIVHRNNIHTCYQHLPSN